MTKLLLTFPSRIIIFYSCFLFIISSESYAQTVTLGSGSDINSVTTSSPVNIWFRKTVCQMVYTAAEISAEGGVAGPINELGFFITNNPLYNLPDYTIEMKHTAATNAAGDLEGGYTTVKTIDDYAPSYGWDMHELDEPFDWDGVQNIVVRICWSRVSPTFDPSGQLRVYPATSGYKYRRNDTGGSACGLIPSTVLNTKPQIRLIFQDETTWTGLVSSDWSTSGNWTAGVPDDQMDAIIPATVPNDPVLNDMGECLNLILEGTLTLGLNGELTIFENLNNTGTYTDLGGITNFNGMLPHEVETSSDLTVTNLRSNSSAGLTLVSGNLIIGEELQVNKGVFNTADALILRSDASGTARIGELRTTCTYTLTMTDSWGDGWNGGFITVLEDGEEIGIYAAVGASSTATFEIGDGSSFVINYTAGSYENENAYTLTDEDGGVVFSDGPTPATGDAYTGTASGCSFSSVIVGDITMQRYIDEGETFWRYFASAVEDPTIEQYLDDFTTAGFPGSPFPDFPFNSIYSYDEAMPVGEGYVACTGTDQVIEVGQGYQVWSGDTITGTEPFLVDLTGPANQGDIVMPVTYTWSDTPSEDGWNLVGNPYASTIDWDSPEWSKTNMANATYIQDPDSQNYATYVSGAGANGGSRYIASQQSFWVHATSESPELIAREGVKSNVDATFFKSGETYSPGMTIQLDGGPTIDEAVIRHIEGATTEVETAFDAVKFYGGWGVNPQLTVVNPEGIDLTVHSFDKGGAEWHIPLHTYVFETGLYQLRFLNTAEMEVPCLKLEDTYTGNFYDIEEGTEVEVIMYDTTFAPRFVLHVGREYEWNYENVSCNGESTGAFELFLDTDEELSYELFWEDLLIEGTGSGNPLVLDDLDAGFYDLVVLDLDDVCGENVFHFSVSEPDSLMFEATIVSETWGSDGEISLNVEGGRAPYAYEWSNGAESANIYGLDPGTYTVLVVDANYCEKEESYVIETVLDDQDINLDNLGYHIYYNGTQETLNITRAEGDHSAYFDLHDAAGNLIQTCYFQKGLTEQSFSLPARLSRGVYTVRFVGHGNAFRFVK